MKYDMLIYHERHLFLTIWLSLHLFCVTNRHFWVNVSKLKYDTIVSHI